VGIDIEEHREGDLTSMGKIAFHREEYDYFLQEPTASRFYELWTLKESYVKMIGSGFSIEPSSFCVLPGKFILPGEGTPFMRNFSCIDGYSLAICAGEPIDAEIINEPILPERQ
jgi:4'-phosphopantetheinyl transferase